MKYLLDKGFTLHPNLVEDAVRSGSPEMVQVLLDKIDPNYSLTEALIAAVEKEHEVVIRMLLASGISTPDDVAVAQAVRKAEEMGLESIAKMFV